MIDEVAGQAIALIAVPLDWKYAIASLILFRAFDIIKPPPVRQLERLPDGTGIMMDDVAAGILALIVVQGMTVVASGVGIGLVSALVLTRLTSSLLFGVGSNDPVALAGVCAVMLTVALLACLAPAARATGLQPGIVLRDG